jgi:SAM-dependent methyltransferase
VTSDWAGSVHPEARQSDVIAPLDSLPLGDGSFDAVVSTVVLEHVLDPAAALVELHRVLAPGGRLWLTTPFVWELHEEPHDYFRYTAHALRELVAGAGFAEVAVEPFGGYFSTLGQLVRSFGSITGRGQPGRGLAGRAASSLLWRVGPLLARLDRLDERRGLPLGYGASAVKPRLPQ